MIHNLTWMCLCGRRGLVFQCMLLETKVYFAGPCSFVCHTWGGQNCQPDEFCLRLLYFTTLCAILYHGALGEMCGFSPSRKYFRRNSLFSSVAVAYGCDSLMSAQRLGQPGDSDNEKSEKGWAVFLTQILVRQMGCFSQVCRQKVVLRAPWPNLKALEILGQPRRHWRKSLSWRIGIHTRLVLACKVLSELGSTLLIPQGRQKQNLASSHK